MTRDLWTAHDLIDLGLLAVALVVTAYGLFAAWRIERRMQR
jgi:hypothetical protein